MEAALPATSRHPKPPLWLLPSGSDQIHGLLLREDQSIDLIKQDAKCSDWVPQCIRDKSNHSTQLTLRNKLSLTAMLPTEPLLLSVKSSFDLTIDCHLMSAVTIHQPYSTNCETTTDTGQRSPQLPRTSP